MNTANAIFKHACLLLCGAGIGWLAGLSLSPVVETILTSLVSIVAGATTLAMGIRSEETKWKAVRGAVSPLPLLLLIIGICGGSVGGLYARSNSLFGQDPEHMKKVLTAAGVPDKEANQYIQTYAVKWVFANLTPTKKEEMPKDGKESKEPAPSTINPGVGLYAAHAENCTTMLLMHGAKLRGFLGSLHDPDIDKLLLLCKDDDALENLKKIYCHEDQ